ncbi:MAG: MBL fold metallo-hydrolase [Chloroflexota bacterium]|nr:MBL fold metallo-hydrolase [Chloroflexota bacterium]
MRLYLFVYGINSANGTPYPGYLIQTDDGTNVLVDTGFGTEMIGAYKQASEPGPKVDEGDYVVNQLAALGLAPRDIRYLVATHLDGDHSGGHDAFPDSEIVIQRSIWMSRGRIPASRRRAPIGTRLASTTAPWTATPNCCPASS